MDNERSEIGVHDVKAAFLGGLLSTGAWIGLYLWWPMAWACVTGFVLMMAFGLFTAKFIFGVQSNWKALGVAPLIGTCWLLLFYGLIYVANL